MIYGYINTSGIDAFIQLLTVLLLFLLVLAATYLVTRWVAKYQKNQLGSQNLEIIETCRLSQTKYIQIIRIGATYMAIAVCKDTITMLGTLDESQLNLQTVEKAKVNDSFQEILNKVKERKQKK